MGSKSTSPVPRPAVAEEAAETGSFGSEEESELDRLYRQALDAVDAMETALEEPLDSVAGLFEDQTVEASSPEESADRPATLRFPSEGDPTGSAADSRPTQSPSRTGATTTAAELSPRATPRQVLEAALFVGGKPLTSKSLAHLLRNEFTVDFLEESLELLNRQYADEHRPYEVRLGEGGWQIALRPEFERVRHRVYGLGPKEVKLSQETLEVLSVVAYHQPVSAEEIVELGKPSPGAALRQLLRRELVEIERGDGGPRDVRYRTTRRFLQLFNLDSLEDLPRPEAIAFK